MSRLAGAISPVSRGIIIVGFEFGFDGGLNMLAEKFMLVLEALLRTNSRDYPDGAQRVVSNSPHVPVKLPTSK
jgi:hypothetical protein